MDLYELLEILTEGHTWSYEGRKADALQLIRDLKAINAFGTVVAGTSANAHQHQWVDQFSNDMKWARCAVCQGETVKVPYMGRWREWKRVLTSCRTTRATMTRKMRSTAATAANCGKTVPVTFR